MQNKLKQVVWEIEPVDFSNNPNNGLQFGSTENNEPAIKLGDKIVTPESLGGNKAFNSIKYLDEYLYEIKYDNLDYKYAEEYFEKDAIIPIGYCSSVRNGNFFGRNYDWYYNQQVNFIIRTESTHNNYASLGVASVAGLTKKELEDNYCSPVYRVLPFFVQDGINEKGVFCSVNVVISDKGETTGTTPIEYTDLRLCVSSVCRFVLDNFATAKEAVEYLQNYVSIYNTHRLEALKDETHYIIGDSNETYIVELVNNELVVINTTENSDSPFAGKPYMTNFYLTNVILNSDGTVYTPETADEDHKPSVTNNIQPHGVGLERYNFIAENYSSANTKEGMRNLMNNLFYTNTYKDETSPRWNSEFTDIENLTVDSPVENFTPVYEYIKNLYENRDREDSETWHTTHSSVYDIQKKKLYLVSQEDTSKEYVFNLKEYYTAAEIDAILESLK